MKKLSLLTFASAALLLAACAATTGANNTPQTSAMKFQHLQPWPMNVARVDVRLEKAHSVQDIVKSPEDVLREYIQARFAPRGFTGRLEVRIEEATVTKSYKESTNDIAKFMNLGGTDVYDVRYKIRLDHYTNDEKPVSGHVVSASRIMNISEHASLSDRQKHQRNGLNALIADLDKEIEKIIVQHKGLLVP